MSRTYLATKDDVQKCVKKAAIDSSYFLKQLYCPYENRVEITASGTWEVPEGVTEIELILVGGGGGGGLTVDTSAKTITVTTKGAGEALSEKAVSVAPGDTLTITVGAGGAAGDGSASRVYAYSNGATSVSGTSCTGSNGGTTSCKVGSATYSARGGGAYTAADTKAGDVYSGEIFGDGAVGDETPLNGVQWKSVSALGKAGKASVTHISNSGASVESYTTVAGNPGGIIIYY